MNEHCIYRRPGEGRTVLVGGADYVTYLARGAETGAAYFAFEVSTTPGFGPPLHTHDYREFFYVLEGTYRLTCEDKAGTLSTVDAGPGTTLAIPSGARHTFQNATGAPARILIVHMPAALEPFFEEFGVPVARVGEVPEGIEAPNPAAMGAALERNGVHVVAGPSSVD
jgi:mannose-6-phosphate isomerase-like protein (cupin superfamily)